MEEFVYFNALFDIYGDLLTEKEQSSFKDYYQENLSLSEIAENKNISRSAVQKTIKKVLEKLNYYEKKLKCYKKNCKLNNLLCLNEINEIKAEIKNILEI